MRVARAVRMGAMVAWPGEVDTDAVAAELGVRNPAHVSWLARKERFDRLRREGKRGQYPGGAPAAEVAPCGVLDSGPWKGAAWWPRCAAIAVDRAVDRTTFPDGSRAAILPQWRLREYQTAAVEDVDRSGGGVVVAPCGAGKTTIGIALVARYATPALVLVHTLDLAKQWVDRARDWLDGVDVAMLGDGKKRGTDTARLVVATIQTLSRWTWHDTHQWGSRYGLVILDEAHHAPAQGFTRVLAGLPGRVRVGLTATEKRHDRLERFLFDSFGPVAFRVEHAGLQASGEVLTPRVTWVQTGWAPPNEDMPSHERVETLTVDPDRQALIVREVGRRLSAGRTVLVLSERVAHCHAIGEALRASGHECEVLEGEVKGSTRTDVLERMRRREVRCVAATQLADEGLDVPAIDVVALVTPTGNVGRVEQRIGRALRPWPGKAAPEVIDFVDDWGPYQGYARRRAKLYRERGWGGRKAEPEVRT